MQPAPTKSQIFRRAHELARWNNNGVNHAPFANWLRHAWSEAKTGNTHNWLWLCTENKLEWLRAQLFAAQVNEFNFNFDQREVWAEQSRLCAEIAAVEAEMRAAGEAREWRVAA